ncbi:MAG: ankyrin repeat domain-containing protein [Pseudomonadota bacterium]
MTELIEAVRAQDIDRVKRLLAEATNLEATDHLGRTALLHAVGNGDIAIVSALLDAGANPSHEDVGLLSAHDYAQLRQDQHLYHLLRGTDAGEIPTP